MVRFLTKFFFRFEKKNDCICDWFQSQDLKIDRVLVFFFMAMQVHISHCAMHKTGFQSKRHCHIHSIDEKKNSDKKYFVIIAKWNQGPWSGYQ